VEGLEVDLALVDIRLVDPEWEEIVQHPQPRLIGAGLGLLLRRPVHEAEFRPLHHNLAAGPTVQKRTPVQREIKALGLKER
jgi:hypothetical protein